MHSSVEAVEMLVTFPANYEGPPNHRHVLQSETFEVIDGKVVRIKATFTPAHHIEYILTEMFASSNRKNAFDSSPFDACYVLGQVKGEYHLGNTPIFIQQTIFPVIAFIGKIFGLVKANPKNK